MKATELVRNRITYAELAFSEIVVWQLPVSISCSNHLYKYRLAYVVDGQCVIRYDNEAGKGDHHHSRGREFACVFLSLDKLLADFQAEVRRFRNENRDS